MRIYPLDKFLAVKGLVLVTEFASAGGHLSPSPVGHESYQALTHAVSVLLPTWVTLNIRQPVLLPWLGLIIFSGLMKHVCPPLATVLTFLAILAAITFFLGFIGTFISENFALGLCKRQTLVPVFLLCYQYSTTAPIHLWCQTMCGFCTHQTILQH